MHHKNVHIVKVAASASHPNSRHEHDQDANESDTVHDIAEAVWSSMLQRVLQQEAKSKNFDELWPNILDQLILKGFSGSY